MLKCDRFGMVPNTIHVHLEPENMILLGNQISESVIKLRAKVRSCQVRLGPGLHECLHQGEKGTQGDPEESDGEWRQRGEQCAYKPHRAGGKKENEFSLKSSEGKKKNLQKEPILILDFWFPEL